MHLSAHFHIMPTHLGKATRSSSFLILNMMLQLKIKQIFFAFWHCQPNCYCLTSTHLSIIVYKLTSLFIIITYLLIWAKLEAAVAYLRTGCYHSKSTECWHFSMANPIVTVLLQHIYKLKVDSLVCKFSEHAYSFGQS